MTHTFTTREFYQGCRFRVSEWFLENFIAELTAHTMLRHKPLLKA